MENALADYSQLALLVLGFGLIVQSLAVLFCFCGMHCFPRAMQQNPRWFFLLLVTGLLVVISSLQFQTVSPWRLVQTLSIALVLTMVLAGLIFRQPEKVLLSGKTAKTGAHHYRVEDVSHGSDDKDARLVTLKTQATRSATALHNSVTIVLIHGGGNDRLYGLWHLIEAVLTQGHQVLTGHLPGHGSGGGDVFSVGAARRRIQSMVAVAKKRNPSRPVVLLGQSLGGALALDGVSRGMLVEAVVTISAPYHLELSTGVLSELRAFGHGAIYRALQYGNIYEVLPAAGGFKRGVFPVRVANGVPYIQEFRNCISQLDLLQQLQPLDLGIPVRLIHGAKDGVVPVAQAHKLAKAIGSQAQVLIYDKCTHLDPLFDSMVIGELLEWLKMLGRSPCRGYGQ